MTIKISALNHLFIISRRSLESVAADIFVINSMSFSPLSPSLLWSPLLPKLHSLYRLMFCWIAYCRILYYIELFRCVSWVGMLQNSASFSKSSTIMKGIEIRIILAIFFILTNTVTSHRLPYLMLHLPHHHTVELESKLLLLRMLLRCPSL